MQIDVEVDGKGDFLVIASNPASTDWTTEGVQVYTDTNSDVGDLTAMFTDSGSTSDGFETLIFERGSGDDPDVAWVRVSPSNPNIVELAVKRSVLGNPFLYLIDMWTGHGLLTPTLFDYSDHYTHEQAGAADPELPSFAQTDVKKLVAYSSVSHLGFVMLGIFALTAQGIQGALLQMVNHGISTGALFLLVGFIYERRHTREMAEFGGRWKIVPIYGSIMLIVALSSMGLPGLNGIVGEFTILLGTWAANPWWAAFAALGVILAAVYILTMFQKMFMGESRNEENKHLIDLSRRELWVIVPLVVFIFIIGIFPQPFFNTMTASVNGLLQGMSSVVALR